MCTCDSYCLLNDADDSIRELKLFDVNEVIHFDFDNFIFVCIKF